MENVISGELLNSERGYCQSSRWALTVIATNLFANAMQSYGKEDHPETVPAIEDPQAQIEGDVREPVYRLTSARLPAACHLARLQPIIPDTPSAIFLANTFDM